MLEMLVERLQGFVVVLLDPGGNFCSWHPGVEEQLGYNKEEFLGKSGEELLPLADRLKGTFRREMQTAREKGRASDISWLVRKDGKKIFVECLCIPLYRPDSVELLGYGKILRDVTDRKNHEEDLRTLARALDQSVVFIRNWDGVIEHWTMGCERLYGWTSAEAVGKKTDDLLQTVYPVPLNSVMEQLSERGMWQGELQQTRKNGTPVFVSANCVAMSDGASQPLHIISTNTDITTRLEMQQELEAANRRLQVMAQELERSNEELEEFARIASHDLSAPITSTRWLVDLLAARHTACLPEDGQNILKQITLGLQRMTDLVDGVLAHARMGRNAISSLEPVSAEPALAVALENLRKDIDLSRASVKHAGLPDVLIHPQSLAQLFQNLISNAIKYRRPNVRPEVLIEAVRDGDLWTFRVRDNGSGIEHGWSERIFQPLQRGHNGGIAGSGIGLATCKKIVERAGGRIWVESELGSGSTFVFTLPAMPAPKPAIAGAP
jgi:PAS domain S-box-containing protein